MLQFVSKAVRLTGWIVICHGMALLRGQQPGNADDAMLLNKTLGHTWPTGALQSNFNIIQSRIFQKLRVPCVFTHEFRISYDGKPCSAWIFRGINTYLIPSGRDALQWQPLAGSPVQFNLKNMHEDFPSSWNGFCVIRRAGWQQYEIKIHDGTIWKYRNGVLAEIDINDLGKVQVECKGTFITSLRLKGESLAEVQVVYDDEMQPVQVLKAGQPVGDFRWDSSGRLRSWTDLSRHTLEFEYDENDLLSGMRYPTVDPVKIAWRENKNWQRGDSKWPLPMHLAQFKDELFEMTLQNRGYVIKISSRTNPAVNNEFSLNPLTLKAQLRIGEQVHEMQFIR